MEETYQGYVIQSIPYLETDAIITLLTERHGLISFKARGIAKITSKNNPSCQLYTFGEYLLDSKLEDGNRVLRTGQILFYPQEAMTNIQFNALLGLFAEGIRRLELDNFDDPFNQFDWVARNYHQETHSMTLALVILGQFINWSGSALEVDHCVNCGSSKQIVSVVLSEGGFICQSCNQELHFPLNEPDYIRSIRLIMKAKVQNTVSFKIDLRYGFRFLPQFFEYLSDMVGVNFKSREVLQSVL